MFQPYRKFCLRNNSNFGNFHFFLLKFGILIVFLVNKYDSLTPYWDQEFFESERDNDGSCKFTVKLVRKVRFSLRKVRKITESVSTPW